MFWLGLLVGGGLGSVFIAVLIGGKSARLWSYNIKIKDIMLQASYKADKFAETHCSEDVLKVTSIIDDAASEIATLVSKSMQDV